MRRSGVFFRSIDKKEIIGSIGLAVRESNIIGFVGQIFPITAVLSFDNINI